MAEPQPRAWPLPAGALPKGLSRVQASAYVGVSPTLFDVMVNDKRMPPPKRIGRRRVWDRTAVDRAFEKLDDLTGESPDPGEAEGDDWDDVAP